VFPSVFFAPRIICSPTLHLHFLVLANTAQVCPSGPKVRVVYIKTHKTGSSTLANMFHRVAFKYGLSIALPTDNTFYAWPLMDRERILNSVYVAMPPALAFPMHCPNT